MSLYPMIKQSAIIFLLVSGIYNAVLMQHVLHIACSPEAAFVSSAVLKLSTIKFGNNLEGVCGINTLARSGKALD